jgi:hypothetical protein
MMTVHSFPQIRSLAPTMILVFLGLIVDLNLKNTGLGCNFGSVSHQWLSQAYASLADRLMNDAQPQPDSSAPGPVANNEESAQTPGRGLMPQRGLTGIATAVEVGSQSATSKARVCVTLARAQFGQGNSLQTDYGAPVRNALVQMMSGPALDIAALDASAAIQVDAEAHQKQCNYILSTAVTVTHIGSGGLGRLMKAGSMAASFTPMGIMAHSMTGMVASQAASTALQGAMMTTQQQALSQLAGFNGQIKSKDEVSVEFRLVATGETQAKLERVLKGKSKRDGEDVLSPLLRAAADGVLNEVVVVKQ